VEVGTDEEALEKQAPRPKEVISETTTEAYCYSGISKLRE
jgi:hypothetical protein